MLTRNPPVQIRTRREQVTMGAALLSAIAVVFLLIARIDVVRGKLYFVGDQYGWRYDDQDWPADKKFFAGDELRFFYDNLFHNVVEVDEAGYRNCVASPASKTFNSGEETFPLEKGTHYFICSVADHCEKRGMKLAIVVN
ncbi:hypothetical protein H6P81_018053 [Aristolochia fimbriata]|uniref:Phytocyanin domain-containing protein n=1 Tax=Aristolochia fimbriata TaxID=158543 RepID=A0AAV7E150_ARIFI|nr:hypothetical protein H6P81_018053 [Aristolochia fimbriata]